MIGIGNVVMSPEQMKFSNYRLFRPNINEYNSCFTYMEDVTLKKVVYEQSGIYYDGCFWDFLSRKYLRQISILGTNR